jgi:hypothetical protein
MLINSENFTIDKLFILFSIAWLLQLKIVSNNLLQVNEITNVKINKTGLVSILKSLKYTFTIIFNRTI